MDETIDAFSALARGQVSGILMKPSETCETCKPAVAESMKLSTLGIAVQEIPVETKKHLHQKYDIDAVPMLLLADEFGVVKSSHLGPVNFENAKESFESVLFDTPKS